MLILPPGHAETARVRRQFTGREKWILRAVTGVAAALVVVVLIAVVSAGHSTGNGCIDADVPYSVGGQEIYQCGAAAVRTCRFAETPQGFTGAAGRAVAIECRKLGLAVGR